MAHRLHMTWSTISPRYTSAPLNMRWRIQHKRKKKKELCFQGASPGCCFNSFLPSNSGARKLEMSKWAEVDPGARLHPKRRHSFLYVYCIPASHRGVTISWMPLFILGNLLWAGRSSWFLFLLPSRYIMFWIIRVSGARRSPGEAGLSLSLLSGFGNKQLNAVSDVQFSSPSLHTEGAEREEVHVSLWCWCGR